MLPTEGQDALTLLKMSRKDSFAAHTHSPCRTLNYHHVIAQLEHIKQTFSKKMRHPGFFLQITQPGTRCNPGY